MTARGIFLSGVAAATLATTRAARSATMSARQFHNDLPGSTLDRALHALWTGVRDATGGALNVTVHAQNAGIAGGDPAALAMVQDGRLEFFTVNGALLANVIPLASFQTLPYVFRTHPEAYRVIDGTPGAALVAAANATRVRLFPGGVFENGFRVLSTSHQPVYTAAAIAGARWRVPESPMINAYVRAVGATPVTVDFNDLPEALRTGRVTAQDNPIVFTAHLGLRLELPYVNRTDHMWAGFNFVANRAYYDRLPSRIRAAIEERLRPAVLAQRAADRATAKAMFASLGERGYIVVDTDRASFRAKLTNFYAPWRARFGAPFVRAFEETLGRPMRAA